jgi:hypothetical protein
VIQADKNLDADARWLKQHGATGTYDQLRAEAMIARLTGRSLASLLPGGTAGTPAAAQPVQPAHLGGSVNLTMPAPAWLGLSDLPGEVAGHGAVDAGTCRNLPGPGRGAGRPLRRPVVRDPHRPERPGRRPRMRPGGAGPARRGQPRRLVRGNRHDRD